MAPNVFSPYGLEALINNTSASENRFIDFLPIWQKMGLEHDKEGAFDGFTPAYSRWRAQLFDASNSHARLQQAVVAISSDGGASRRYVIFKRESSSDSGWQVLGNIDILDGRFEGSPHQQFRRVVSDARHTWLLLRALGASGTGTYQINEIWYEIHGHSPQQALEYSIEGWHEGDVSDREFSSRLISEGAYGRSFRVEVMFCVSYGARGSKLARLSKRQRASYLWNADEARFALDESRSALTQHEIETVYSPGCLSQSEFLQYNSAELAPRALHDSTRSH